MSADRTEPRAPIAPDAPAVIVTLDEDGMIRSLSIGGVELVIEASAPVRIDLSGSDLPRVTVELIATQVVVKRQSAKTTPGETASGEVSK